MITNKEYKNFQDADYTILPMSREIVASGETPLSLYSKIADQQNNFLFESVEGGDRWAQYSIIGFGCIDTIKISGKKPRFRAKATETWHIVPVAYLLAQEIAERLPSILHTTILALFENLFNFYDCLLLSTLPLSLYYLRTFTFTWSILSIYI